MAHNGQNSTIIRIHIFWLLLTFLPHKKIVNEWRDNYKYLIILASPLSSKATDEVWPQAIAATQRDPGGENSTD